MSVQAGMVEAKHGDPGWSLSAGSGDRYVDRLVTFPTPFPGPPVVHLGITGMDSVYSENPRIVVEATNVTQNGCSIRFRTWADSKVVLVRVNWLAIGS